MPSDVAQRPQVLKCAALTESEFSTQNLGRLARRLSVSNFGWTVPLSKGEYKIVVLPEPAVKPTEIAESVRWSLGTMLEFPVETAALDWLLIPTAKHAPQRQQHIYAIVTPGEVVQKYADAFRQARVPLAAVDIRETAQRNIATLVQKPGEAIGMISISHQGLLITFTFEGELYLDRFIEFSLDAGLLADDEARARLFERVTLQVQRSLDFVRRTLPFMPIGRLLIAPLPAPLPLREFLAQNIAEPIEMLDLGTVFDFAATPELAQEEQQSRYFFALGAALRGMETE